MKVSFELNGRVIVRWILGVLFTWAAVSKLPNLQEFYSSIIAYQLPLPDLMLRLTAETLPWLGCFAGCCYSRACGIGLRCSGSWFCPRFFSSPLATLARGLHLGGCMNLDFLGSGPGAKTAIKFLESAPFAFLRSIVLLAAGWYLYTGGAQRELPSPAVPQ